jgi:hypothetical protein
MPIPQKILERIETFVRNQDSYTKGDYKEAQVRQEFIDPFFEALGWDVRNERGYAEAYKDVVHEDSLRASGVATKAPDYSFRIGGTRKFFVEAKKPAIHLKDDPEPARQLRVYSWSAKLSLGIVTDFQEFAIYDTRVKPVEGDKAAVARIFYCTYEQYPEKWHEIADIFSREAILKGSFDRYAGSTKNKKGTAAVDDAFLEEIEHWRAILARNVALRNRQLTQRDLNFSVQRIIDRIIFLRIAEDRGIESYGQLAGLTKGDKIYARLCEIFERADYRYNSGLFHFAGDRQREEAPDLLTMGLHVDDATLKEILGHLYYPKSPYAFAVIPADILGHVYEQFLGKVIYLTAGHRAEIEDKPEVRKAGGVYYTPTYIVDYIVRRTVGPLVEGKSPKQVSKITILDPACGSGSFLLGAYEFLLDWYLRYYIANDPQSWAKKKNPPIYEIPSQGAIAGDWQLTTSERKRILTANLFGADIDPQAVEVTKLSLLLKVLEGEARELRGKTQDMYRVLPDLGKNIKCGNSLIASDFYHQLALPEMDMEARLRINAFDWQHEFKGVMDGGGFDAIVGNPPYGADFDPTQEEYLRQRYQAVSNSFDSFIMFMEKAGSLLAAKGRLGMIIPSGWVSTPSSRRLRLRFAELYRPETFVSLPYDVFKGAYIDTMIVVASRLKHNERWASLPDGKVPLVVFPIRHKVGGPDDFERFTKQGDFRKWVDSADAEFLVLSSTTEEALVAKLRKSAAKLDDVVEVMRGIETYRPRERELCKQPKRAFNGDMLRYHYDLGPEAYEAYPSEIEADKPLRFFTGPRILLRQLLSRKFRLQAIYTEEEFLTNQSVQSLVPRGPSPSPLAILGILNSKLMSWYFCQINLVARRDDFPKTIIKQTRELRFPDVTGYALRENEQPLISHVRLIQKLYSDVKAVKNPTELKHIEREIERTEQNIDNIVYRLFALTPEEVAVVEATSVPLQFAIKNKD